MRRLHVVLICNALFAGMIPAPAQVVPTATRPKLTLSAGGIGSIFQPDYAGTGVPAAGPQALYGFGTYVDVGFRRWIQIEGEARWLRINEFANISEDNYLIGPRVPITEFHRFKPYGKALFGYGRMNFQYNFAYGHFADLALGGGVDYELNSKFDVRAFDFEYQFWPNGINGTLQPYGGSVGVAYKIF